MCLRPTRFLFRAAWSIPCLLSLYAATAQTPPSHQGTSISEVPRIAEKDGRYALMVDGRPYLMLGAQLHNSSAWPAMLPTVWASLDPLHVNTVEAPIYWEQLEPQPGLFDYSVMDTLIDQARQHHVHLVLLWFATWKNGSQHYTPAWMKLDTVRYPRVIGAKGEPMDILSPHSENNIQADIHAFTALMRHLKMKDGAQHTVLMVQVENESGTYGTVRDFSAAAEKEFAGQVPEALAASLHKSPGTWKQVFAPDADEAFAAYSIAHYIDQVAAAGKAEYPLPMYVNVALRDPEDPNARPGANYPSGGPSYNMLDVWKATAKSIDLIAPDIYLTGDERYRKILSEYKRADNPLFVPETSSNPYYARYFFTVLGRGSIGFSPFGVDRSTFSIATEAGKPSLGPTSYASSPLGWTYSIFAPMAREIAQLNYDGKLQTAMEVEGTAMQTLSFDNWKATVSYGLPPWGYSNIPAPGNPAHDGRAMVAELGPDEFLVTGFRMRVDFSPVLANKQRGFLRVEEGHYEDGKWVFQRIWNGDETDFGLNFTDEPHVLRVKLYKF